MAKFDPGMKDTNVFYFDGASSVQKAGRVREKNSTDVLLSLSREKAYYDVALFFDDVAKLKPIRVSSRVSFFISSSSLNISPHLHPFCRNQ